MRPINLLAFSLLAATSASDVRAGAFLFAESQANADIITHPTGYSGMGGTLELSVCIATDSESRTELEIPVRNAVYTWTAFEPTNQNLTSSDPELEFQEYDAESVLLHELGHCVGLAHPNLANESGLGNTADWDYAKTLEGPNEAYDLDVGTDGIRGSRDDLRGDDINLNWFHTASNDPFQLASVIDLTTFSNDPADLPSGHNWVEIAAFDVSQLRGQGSGEGVMNQGTFNQETQRQLHNEDATTLRLGMAGLDGVQGTADDYDLRLTYQGVADDCDITIRMDGGGFGVCQVSGAFIGGDRVRVTEATITLGSTSAVNWYFSDTLTDDSILLQDRFEQ